MTRVLHLFLALAATVSVAVSVDFKYLHYTSTTCAGTPDNIWETGKCADEGSMYNSSRLYESIAECKKGAELKYKLYTKSKTCAGTGAPREWTVDSEVDECIASGTGSYKFVCGGAAATGISAGALLLSALVAVISM